MKPTSKTILTIGSLLLLVSLIVVMISGVRRGNVTPKDELVITEKSIRTGRSLPEGYWIEVMDETGEFRWCGPTSSFFGITNYCSMFRFKTRDLAASTAWAFWAFYKIEHPSKETWRREEP